MALSIDKLAQVQRLLKEKKRAQKEILSMLFRFIGFRKGEIELYSLLLNKEMEVKRIMHELGISERSARAYLKVLWDRGLVEKKVLAEKRLKYVYFSIKPDQVWMKIKSEILVVVEEIDSTIKQTAVLP